GGDRQVVGGQRGARGRVQLEGDAAAADGDVGLVAGGPGCVGHPADEHGGGAEVVEPVGPPDAVAVPLPARQVPQERIGRFVADGVHGGSFNLCRVPRVPSNYIV